MDYKAFRRTIRDSSPRDWQRIVQPNVEHLQADSGGLKLFVSGHPYVAHYKPDLDISIAWGAEQNEGKPWGPGHGGWGQSFPDSKVYGAWADLRWRASAVDQELYCIADGGRYYMPVMDADEPEGGWGSGNPIIRWKVRPDAIWLPKLLHGIAESYEDFDAGLARTGAVEMDY